MRTFDEMKSAAARHNAKQDRDFLGKLVREIAAEIDSEECPHSTGTTRRRDAVSLSGTQMLCGYCGRPVGFGDASRFGSDGRAYHYECTRPPNADEITRLRAEVKRIRNDTLEEAAKVAKNERDRIRMDRAKTEIGGLEYAFLDGQQHVADAIATAIRAMKGETP